MRAASIFEYLETRYTVDAILFRENDAPIAIPGARDLLILDLPRHARHRAARAFRNARRFVAGRPPLLDRFSGFDARIAAWLDGRRYDLCVIEHFWCAPYAGVLRDHVDRLVLDLHNIESRLQETSAECEAWPVSTMLRRFAAAYGHFEREWLPRFNDVLTASQADAARIAGARLTVYPNTIPLHEAPRGTRDHAIIFTGNMEYAPNVAAVRWFARNIWPLLRAAEPDLEWRLAGRNPHAIAPYLKGVAGLRVVGPVRDAVEEIGRAKVAVVPLRSGSGTRFKILEAWAANTPVVSTRIGAEGLDAVDQKDLLIADHPPEFAQAVLQALREPGRLGRNGRELYLGRYTTEAGWKVLADLGL